MTKRKRGRAQGQARQPSGADQTAAARRTRKKAFVRETVGQSDALVAFVNDEIYVCGLEDDRELYIFLLNQIYGWDSEHPTYVAIKEGAREIVQVSKKEMAQKIYRNDDYVIFPGGDRVSYFEMDKMDLLWFILHKVYAERGANLRFQILKNLILDPKTGPKNRDEIDDILDELDEDLEGPQDEQEDQPEPAPSNGDPEAEIARLKAELEAVQAENSKATQQDPGQVQ